MELMKHVEREESGKRKVKYMNGQGGPWPHNIQVLLQIIRELQRPIVSTCNVPGVLSSDYCESHTYCQYTDVN